MPPVVLVLMLRYNSPCCYYTGVDIGTVPDPRPGPEPDPDPGVVYSYYKEVAFFIFVGDFFMCVIV